MKEAEKVRLANQVTAYFNELRTLGLQDKAILSIQKPSVFAKIGIGLGYIPYLLGRMFNFLPLCFGKWWADNKVEEIVFYAPLQVSLALAAYIFYALFLLLIAIIMGRTWFWLSLPIIPLLGYFSLYYYEFRANWKAQQQVTKTDSKIIDSLRNKRANILEKLSVAH